MEDNNPEGISDVQSQISADFRKSVGLAPKEPVHVSDPAEYNPRPKSIDLLKNFTGNTFSGPTPSLTGKLPEPSDFADQFTSYIKQKAESSTGADKFMKPFSFNGDYDGANFERYYSHNKFKKLGFNPYRDNEALYNNNSTLGDEFSRAASQWPSLIKSGFMSGIRSWETLFTDPLAPDRKGAQEMEKAMAIGSSSKKGAGSFAVNTFLNSGYTIGIGGEMLLEELALAGLTAVTAGALSEVTLPAMFVRGARAGKAILESTETIGHLAKPALETLPEIKSFWNTVGKGISSAGNVVNPLENSYKYAKDVFKGEKYSEMAAKQGKNIAEFAGWSDGFGAFARDMIQIKSAVGEAKLEGGMTQMNITKDLTQKYRDAHNGEEPPADEIATIGNLAREEAKRTALWNLPAIMWSNKFIYAIVMRPFEKTASKTVKDIVFDAKAAPGELFQKVGTGVLDRGKNTLKSLAKPKVYGEYGLNYLKANFAEGIQENLQEAISMGAASHAVAQYTNKDRGAYESYMGHFMKGLGAQASAQGLETFAGGLAMGAFAQPVMAAPVWLAQTTWNNTVKRKSYGEYKAKRDKELDEQSAQLNEMYQNPMTYFAPQLANAIKQGNISGDFIETLKEESKKGNTDTKNLAIFEHLTTALQTNNMDILLKRTSELKGFTPEQAEEAWGLESGQGKAALEMVDKIVERGTKLKSTYEAIQKEFPNPFSPGKYTTGTDDFTAHAIGHVAWQNATKNYLFAKNTYEEHKNRLTQIADAFTKQSSPLANTNAQSLHLLLNPNLLNQRLDDLNKQMKNLDESDPAQRKEKNKLTTEHETLTEFQDSIWHEDLNKKASKTQLEELKAQGIDATKHRYNPDRPGELMPGTRVHIAGKNNISTIKDIDEHGNYILADDSIVSKGEVLPVTHADYHNAVKEDNDVRAKKALRNYLKHISKGTDEIIFNDKLNHAFDLIKDSVLLRDEMTYLGDSINVLSSPQGYMKTFHAIHKGLQNVYDNRYKLIRERLRNNVNKIEIDRGLRRLFSEQGVFLDGDYIDSFTEALDKHQEPGLPSSFILHSTEKPITEGEVFNKALDIWKETINLLKVKPEEPIVEEDTALTSKTEPVATKPSTGIPLTSKSLFTAYPTADQEKMQADMINYIEDKYEGEDDDIIQTLQAEYLETATLPNELRRVHNLQFKEAEVKPETTQDWNKLIQNAISERELNAIQDQIGDQNTPELTDAIAKRREDFKKEPLISDIEAKRQEAINKATSQNSHWSTPMIVVDDVKKTWWSKADMLSDINSGVYDKQLTTSIQEERTVEQEPDFPVQIDIAGRITDAKTLEELDKLDQELSLQNIDQSGETIEVTENMLANKKAELLKDITPENLKWVKKNNKRVVYNDPKNPDISGPGFAVALVGKKYVTISKPSLKKKIPIGEVNQYITLIMDPMEQQPQEEISTETKATAKSNLVKEKQILDNRRTEAADVLKKADKQSKDDTDSNLINKLC